MGGRPRTAESHTGGNGPIGTQSRPSAHWYYRALLQGNGIQVTPHICSQRLRIAAPRSTPASRNRHTASPLDHRNLGALTPQFYSQVHHLTENSGFSDRFANQFPLPCDPVQPKAGHAWITFNSSGVAPLNWHGRTEDMAKPRTRQFFIISP